MSIMFALHALLQMKVWHGKMRGTLVISCSWTRPNNIVHGGSAVNSGTIIGPDGSSTIVSGGDGTRSSQTFGGGGATSSQTFSSGEANSPVNKHAAACSEHRVFGIQCILSNPKVMK